MDSKSGTQGVKDMGVRKKIDLSAEVRDAHTKVVAGLERSSLFALLGERLGKLPSELELPQGNIIMSFGGPRPVDGVPPRDLIWTEMKEEFAEYCARYAIIGMVTVCEMYLQRLLFIARLGQEASQHGGKLTGEAFYTIRSQCLKEIRNSSVDGLVTKILNMINCDTSAIAGLDWFRSVYSLRKCLLHRGGAIGQDDVDDKGLLTTVWRRPVLSVNGEDVSALPLIVKEGGTLEMRFNDEVRTWNVGERLQLTAQDCQDIGMSLAFFASQINNELNKGLAAMIHAGS